jgi:xylulokinase
VEEVCRAPQVAATFAPDAAEAAVLGPRHARFKALYRAVEGLFPTA